ncbi:hypothetical protein F5880DRAFT_122289 [Lentinula raphanica]|nr:hypothetical protein F5880DRAFT_122289 [Lentinula raphanica]
MLRVFTPAWFRSSTGPPLLRFHNFCLLSCCGTLKITAPRAPVLLLTPCTCCCFAFLIPYLCSSSRSTMSLPLVALPVILLSLCAPVPYIVFSSSLSLSCFDDHWLTSHSVCDVMTMKLSCLF